MRNRILVAALLLLTASAATTQGQESAAAPAEAPAAEEKGAWEWLCNCKGGAIASGNPEVSPDFWQQTWGIAGADIFPAGRKMAPNGVPYDPIFALDLLLNIALTRDRDIYIFSKARFWAEKAGEGVTNKKQGNLDFSKRQFDLDGGIAWNFYGPLEARAWAYSDNNLNRGTKVDRPAGYNDGFALECRYYMPSTDFDRGLYRYASVGYYLTKELVGADGDTFHPGFFVSANLALDLMPDRLYTYLNCDYISRDNFRPKLLLADPGIAMRPFQDCPNLEFRVGVENNIDLELSFTRAVFYGNVRIIW